MSELNVWPVWDHDADAVAVREQLDFEAVQAARAQAMTRDMRKLRERAKQYKRIAEEARKAGDLDRLTTAKRLRDLCRQIINASQQHVRETIDYEGMSDMKARPRDRLASYTYDSYDHAMRRETTTVSAQVRDAAWPPVLDYPEIAQLLPDLPQR